MEKRITTFIRHNTILNKNRNDQLNDALISTFEDKRTSTAHNYVTNTFAAHRTNTNTFAAHRTNTNTFAENDIIIDIIINDLTDEIVVTK